MKGGRGMAASHAQRRKAAGALCACGCGRSPCDAAHVCSRAQGGCADPLCTVPLYRVCHREFDLGNLDLLPALEARHKPELAHAVEHMGLLRALRRVTGQRWIPDPRQLEVVR